VRDAGGDALVIADELRGLCDLWDLAGEAVQALGGPQAGLASDRKDSAQQRIFYASLLQRASQMNDDRGGGSLTILGLLQQQPKSAGSATSANASAAAVGTASTAQAGAMTQDGPSSRTFTLDDFASRPQAERARIEALLTRGVTIDDDVLAKLGMRPPPPPSPPPPLESNSPAPAPGMQAVPLVPSSPPPTGAPAWPLPPLPAHEQVLMAARRSIGHTDQLTSLADGHVQLQKALFDQNRRPATLPTDSLARVGAGSDLSEARAQPSTAAMRRVAQYLRLELAQAKDLLPPNSNDSSAIRQQRMRAAAVQAVLCRQTSGAPFRLSHQVTLLHAVAAGHLDHLADASDDDVTAEMHKLLAHTDAKAAALLKQVDVTGVLDAEGEQRLRALAADVLPPAKGRAFFTNYDRSTWSS
jgi:hypothetical protein